MTQPTRLEARVPEFAAPPPSRTPQLLRRLQIITAAAVLVAGALATWVMADLHNDLASVPNLAQQHARLGEAQHALSTAADLVARGMLSPEDHSKQNAAATKELAKANGLLIEAAKDRPQDAEHLQALGEGVLQYSASLDAASRASQADAVAAMIAADAQLKSLLDGIDELQSQLRNEATILPWSMTSPGGWLVGAAMFAVIVWASWIVAQRSHRAVNAGLAGSGIAIILMLVLAVSAQSAASEASIAGRNTQFGRVETATTAIRSLDAAQHALIMGALSKTWNSEAAADYAKALAQAKEAGSGLPSLARFEAVGGTITDNFDRGRWSQATTLLLTKEAKSLTATADQFREKAVDRAETAAESAGKKPLAARGELVTLLVAVIALALAGSALAVLGLSWRLKEYQ